MSKSLQRSIQREPVVRNHADLVWSVADLLRGDYKRSEYGRVILPLVVLRRLDGVLSPTKEKVLSRYNALEGRSFEYRGPIVRDRPRPLRYTTEIRSGRTVSLVGTKWSCLRIRSSQHWFDLYGSNSRGCWWSRNSRC